MSRTPLLFALLGLLVEAPTALCGPPEGPSGRLVQDAVPALAAEVKRLEKEAISGAISVEMNDELHVAYARLAAAEGRTEDARYEWRELVSAREKRLARWISFDARRPATRPDEHAIYRGGVAKARCGLAEVEGDRAVLARELPELIASYEARLRLLDESRKKGANETEVTDEERAIRKELRQARRRLDAVKRR
jgi:predicted component of type VI protein secretion system